MSRVSQTLSRSLWLLSLLSCAITVHAGQSIVQSLDDVKPISGQTAAPVPRMIVGEPTSSLSKAQALTLAQALAAKLPGAGVADLSKDYNGALSPAIPCNAILVVEPVKYAQLKPFDLALYTDPNGKISARRILAKGETRAEVGYELDPNATTQVDGKSFIARIVAWILFDPSVDS